MQCVVWPGVLAITLMPWVQHSAVNIGRERGFRYHHEPGAITICVCLKRPDLITLGAEYSFC